MALLKISWWVAFCQLSRIYLRVELRYKTDARELSGFILGDALLFYAVFLSDLSVIIYWLALMKVDTV